MHHREASLAMLLGLVLVYAWSAEVLGSVATITGAYLLGVVVARHADESHIVHAGTSSLGYAFFIPIFFINIGLQAHADGLIAAPLLTIVLIVVAIADQGRRRRRGRAGWAASKAARRFRSALV